MQIMNLLLKNSAYVSHMMFRAGEPFSISSINLIMEAFQLSEMKVEEIYSVSPEDAVTRLREKLNKKIENLKKQGKEIRRLQINLTFSDIKSMKSFRKIY